MSEVKLFRQLYISNVLIVIIALSLLTVFAATSVYYFTFREITTDLTSKASLLAGDFNDIDTDDGLRTVHWKCENLSKRGAVRITIIAADGRVIADSDFSSASLKDHRYRTEIHKAIEGRTNSVVRYSETGRENTIFSAVPIARNGKVFAVFRLAIPAEPVEDRIRGTQWYLTFGGILITILSGVASFFASRNVTRPIDGLKQAAKRFAAGDLDFRLDVPESHEFRDFAEVMNTMAAQLQERLSIIARQTSEQIAVFTSMIEGVLAFDINKKLININASAVRMLNLQPEYALGKSITDIIQNIELQHFIAETIAGGKPIEGYFSILDGQQERFLQLHGSLLRDNAGLVLGALVVLNDITELRKLETMRRDFVANVSHELKTPITSIKGFVETLLDGALQDKNDTLRFLGIISRQADRLNSIIEDLLSLSRIEQGAEKEQIEFTETPIEEVLSSAVQSSQVDAEAKQMKLILEAPAHLYAEVNPALLEQAVVNLISNAVKYSEDGKRVWVQAVSVETMYVQITVKDEGYGIDAEHLPRLFERFYRIDKARSRTLGGTGLGLAIVKHIVQAHHGQIEVTSTLGFGSAFIIRIPLMRHSSELYDSTPTNTNGKML